MQEYAHIDFDFESEVVAQECLETLKESITGYEFEEPEKCNWVDYLKTSKKTLSVGSDAMCGWLDYQKLVTAVCKAMSEKHPTYYYEAESEYTNISGGFTCYMGAKFNSDGLDIKESTICCEYCGRPIFDDDAIYMRNEDEGAVVFCCDDCKARFLDEGDMDEDEWEVITAEEYEEETMW